MAIDSDVVLDGVSFDDNIADETGGALANHAPRWRLRGPHPHVRALDLHRQPGQSCRGRAIYEASVQVTGRNSSFVDNSGGVDGAVRFDGTSAVDTLTNVTFSGNHAGAATDVVSTGTLEVRSSTFVSDGCGSPDPTTCGRPVISNVGSSSLTLADSIVVAAGAPACAGSIVNGGGNIEWPVASCGFGTLADPLLGPLSLRNGTQSHQPLPGSPAIDGGGSGVRPPTSTARLGPTVTPATSVRWRSICRRRRRPAPPARRS